MATGRDSLLHALRGLDTVIAIVALDGEIHEANRDVDAANLLELFADRHRDAVRALLMTSAFSSRPTRIQATDVDHRPGWLEITSHEDGRAVAVWMPAFALAPAATPAPAARRVQAHPRPPAAVPVLPEDQTTDVLLPAYVLVSDPQHREMAIRLKRTLEPVASTVGMSFVPNVQGDLTRASPLTRVVVLGNSRYTRFLRGLVGSPSFALAGVCWAVKGRRAAVWYQDPSWEADAALSTQQDAFDALVHEVQSATALSASEPYSHSLASSFLEDLPRSSAERKRSHWPDRMRYSLGICRFLIDGFPKLAGWDPSSQTDS